MQEIDQPIASLVRVGDILAGKYRVERILGTGGMGVVVAAQHLQLDERVAIKFLLPSALAQPDAVARFMREAKSAVRIKGEHVVRVTDVGMLENSAPYMVMEYLEGTDLAKWLQKHGPAPVEVAVDFVLQALEAMHDAHGMGIIHRDLKPANLFCTQRRDGASVIKVLDFGISKVTDGRETSALGGMTTAATVMGSPLYMSPEQMRSARDVDAGTDIWAIGVILYELLTGTAPFAGETLSEVCVKAASCAPPSIRERRPELPAELETVILKCLEKDPTNRYQKVVELANALQPFAPKRPSTMSEWVSPHAVSSVGNLVVAHGTLRSSDHAVVAGSLQTEVSWGRTNSRRPSTRWRLIGLVAVVPLLAVALGVWWFLRAPVDTTEEARASAGISTVNSLLPRHDVEPLETPTQPLVTPVLAATSPEPSVGASSANLRGDRPVPDASTAKARVARPRKTARKDLFAGPQ